MGEAAAPPDHLQPRHRRFLAIEIAIGMVVSGVVAIFASWLLHGGRSLPVRGPDSLASSLIMGTLVPGFFMPVILTFVVRRRVRKGTAPALGWPLRNPGLVRWLPAAPVLRGVVAACIALLVLPPAGLLMLSASGVKTIGPAPFLLYNFCHGLALGALVLPTILTRALADASRARALAAPPLAAPPLP